MADEHWRHLAGLDPHALDQLMAEYGQTVWNYAFLLVKHRAMADDITQDVFLKAYRRCGGIEARHHLVPERRRTSLYGEELAGSAAPG
ncbi:RNA polymerase sigma factor [Thermobacillus xylanilyticus]|uniref:RNA polymerase sigma factor n=1 Tax=Thermobacillus xylanilyticus TaxID=76633 RepID=A0ABM8V1T9_THEXY|nr:sigma factor [Thermobacillus xylanilyticus]CAG5081771.1 RNA polymerase sigma factor [Thermobacillus xylanilyticus]